MIMEKVHVPSFSLNKFSYLFIVQVICNSILTEVEEKVASGSEVIDTVSGKKVGTVTMALGCHGMGVLRLNEAFKAGSLIIQGREEVKVDAIRPEWWPSDWYQDHQQHGAVA